MSPEFNFHVRGEFSSLSAARKFRDAVQKVLGDDSIVFLEPEKVALLDKFEEEAPTAKPQKAPSPQVEIKATEPATRIRKRNVLKRRSPRVETTKRELAKLEAIPYEELTFAQLLKKLRLQGNMSRPALGEAAHVSPITISGYENGSNPPRGDSIGRLINGLKIDQDGEVANRLRTLGHLEHVKRSSR